MKKSQDMYVRFSKKWLFFVVLLCLSHFLSAQETQKVASLQDILALAKSKNFTFQQANLQTQLAELTRKTAIANVLNPKILSSAQAIDNIKQQVNFLPGQAFGMPEGTFREITIGQQYVSTFSLQPQFDLLNLATISQVKSAKINQQLVDNQNKMNEQKIYEQINAIYCNILSFEGQKEVLQENKTIAEQILKITKAKFEEGIARKQELNEAEVNLISLQDKLEQLDFNLKLQYQSLHLFFENELVLQLSQKVWDYESEKEILQTQNKLKVENATLQTQFALQEYKTLQYQNYPVLSFVSAFNWQNLSNKAFFDSQSNWINFNYIGLKLSWDFPNVQKISSSKSKKIQIESLKINALHSQKENDTQNAQMSTDLEKALKQLQNLQKIYALKKDTYEKNYNQFSENILPLDRLLISQNDMLVSRLNMVAALATIGFSKNKIEINNGF